MKNDELEKFYKLVGEKIIFFRKNNRKTITQKLLGEKIGLSRASIVNIEKGRQKVSLHLLWQIAEIFNIELNQLIPTKNELSKTTDSDINQIIKKASLNDNDKTKLKNIIENMKNS